MTTTPGSPGLPGIPPGPSLQAAAGLESLPFPVAHPLSYARDEAAAVSNRVDNAVFAAYQAVRTTALLLLSDYLACDVVAREVGTAIQGLRLPHWKEWVTLADQLARFWAGGLDEKPERPCRFPVLRDAWLGEAHATKLPKGSEAFGLLRPLPGKPGLEHNAIETFWHLRNHRAHEQGTRTGDEMGDSTLVPWLLPLLERTLSVLFPQGSFSLLRQVGEGPDGPQVIRLHGAHRDLTFQIEPLSPGWAPLFGTTGVVAVTDEDYGEGVTIYPLFLTFDPENPSSPGGSGGMVEEVDDVYLLESFSERKASVLGSLYHRRLKGEKVREVVELLGRKKVAFGVSRRETTRWSLRGWSTAAAEATLEALRGRKYFPSFYLERRGVDDRVRRVLRLPGADGTPPAASAKGIALLLLGEAGSGKSSLLVRLVESIVPPDDEGTERSGSNKKKTKVGADELDSYLAVRDAGDVVIYASGPADFTGDAGLDGEKLLCNVVLAKAGVRRDAFETLEALAARIGETAKDDRYRDRKVWIVLDGINEAPRFGDLVAALDRFLPVVEGHPWLRLVVSMRSGAYHSLARRDRESLAHGSVVFKNARCWEQFEGPAGLGLEARAREAREPVPYLEIRPFRLEVEGPEAYRLRQGADERKSCPATYATLGHGLRALLLSPLHLHLFHEAFAGVSDPPALLDETRLFEAYLDTLTRELPGLASTLPAVGKRMLASRRPFLSLEEADELMDGWWSRSGGAGSAGHAKLDPVEELVAASILMRPAEEGLLADRKLTGFQFTQQKLAEAVLRRALLERIKPRTRPEPEELLRWAGEASGSADGDRETFVEMLWALELMVGAFVEEGDGETAAALLDLEDEGAGAMLFALALGGVASLVEQRGEPRPEANAFIASLETALSSKTRRLRFENIVWEMIRVFKRIGAGRSALALSRLRVRVMRKLVALEPGRLDLRRDLTSSLNLLANLLSMHGDSAEARRLSQESMEVLTVA